jgi:GT2 family glycosyltransferase
MSNSLGILITYHNERNMLTECLESIKSQKDTIDEILVYDDASFWPAKDYIPSSMENQVQCVRGEFNRGQGYSRNVLLNLSQSEYVHFHDSDDIFLSEWSTATKTALNNNQKADIILSKIQAFDGHIVYNPEFMNLNVNEFIYGLELIPLCIHGGFLPSQVTFRKELGKKIGGIKPREEMAYSEDYDFHLRLALSEPHVIAIPDVLIAQRWKPNSNCRDSKNEFKIENLTYQVQSLLENKSIINSKYWVEIAERLITHGDEMIERGFSDMGFEVIKTSAKIGKLAYFHKSKFFAIVARKFGPLAAFKMSYIYRKIMPLNIRRILQTIYQSLSS